MIINLPARQSAKSSQYTPSFILYDQARSYEWEGAGQLSLKTFRGGEARYRVGNAQYRLDSRSYLLLNHQQTYSIALEAVAPVESFCLFFEPGLAEEIHYALVTKPEKLLDDPARSNVASDFALAFFERTYPHDLRLSLLVEPLRQAIEPSNAAKLFPAGLSEQFHRILQRLLELHYGLYQEVNSLQAARLSTREELYRRLYRARDYLHACYDQPLTLDEVARQVSLSPNHLLRTFKQLFGQTPHQYLTDCRLDRACQLLSTGQLSVTEVALAVGFESVGSFSWLFSRRLGISPQGYQRQTG